MTIGHFNITDTEARGLMSQRSRGYSLIGEHEVGNAQTPVLDPPSPKNSMRHDEISLDEWREKLAKSWDVFRYE